MSKLEVPLDAYNAWCADTYRAKKRLDGGSHDDRIRAIATPIVIAELRNWIREAHIAADMAKEGGAPAAAEVHASYAAAFRRRVDELAL